MGVYILIVDPHSTLSVSPSITPDPYPSFKNDMGNKSVGLSMGDLPEQAITISSSRTRGWKGNISFLNADTVEISSAAREINAVIYCDIEELVIARLVMVMAIMATESVSVFGISGL